MTDFAPQRSEAWYKARAGRVTGSCVGAILGLDPNKTRKQVMRDMVRDSLGLDPEHSDFLENTIFAHGRHYEEGAKFDYEMESCQDVEECGFITYSDWLGASPDGKICGGRGIIEIKCPWSKRKQEKPQFKSASESQHHFAQMQIEMECAAADFAHYYQWTPYGTRLETVFPDRDWLETNLPILRDFWLEFKAELATNPDDYRNPLRVEVDTPDAHRAVAEYDQLVEAIANAEERKKELLLDIAAMTNEQDGLIAGRKLTRVQKAGSVSYAKALKALLPDADLAPYTGKSSSFWKLS